MNTILQGQIKGADKELSNLSNRQKALRNIGGRPNRNLLDNAYFVGGGSQQGGGQFPINQRGQTSWIGNGIHLDRWYEEQSVAGSIEADGYHVGPGQTVIQRHTVSEARQFLGKTITVSCLLSDGTFAANTGTVPENIEEGVEISCDLKPGVHFIFTYFYSASSYQFGRIQNTSGSEIIVVACKAELGPTQTLAYQDEDGNWQLFETPDYVEELAKCQRYLRTYDVVWATAPSIASEYLQTQVVYEPMAGVPTITVGSIANFGGTEQPDLNVVSTQKSENAWWIVRSNQSISANIMLQLKNVFLEAPI